MHRQPPTTMTEIPSSSLTPNGKVKSFISCSRGYPQDGGDFEFHPPAEAPIFRPTEEEFALGPLRYVAKIRPIAEPYGICKIIPPASFKPNFAVDKNHFTFTPRVQRLNELEAMTRIKLNFLEQLVKFWDLQGYPFKIPYVEKKTVDLYLLHKVVQEEGGFESCTREKKWSRVASRLGYNMQQKSRGPIASLLRQHYERILFPYDVFLSGATIGPEEDLAAKVIGSSNNSTVVSSGDENSCDSKDTPCLEESSQATEDSASQYESDPSETKGSVRKVDEESEDEPKAKQLRQSPRRMGRRMGGVPSSSSACQTRRSPGMRYSSSNTSSSITPSNRELKKLQVHGAGPKMPGVVENVSPSLSSSSSSIKSVSSSSHDLSKLKQQDKPQTQSSNGGEAATGGGSGDTKEGKKVNIKLCVLCFTGMC